MTPPDDPGDGDEPGDSVEPGNGDEPGDPVEPGEEVDDADSAEGADAPAANGSDSSDADATAANGSDSSDAAAPAANEAVDVESLSTERVLVTLPESLRSAFKEPFGPVETDVSALLESVAGPLIAVGDMVTYHFLEAGRPPDVAVVDEHTKRQLADEAVREAVVQPDLTVPNPPGALSEPLVAALREAVGRDEPTTILVEGEEDLAVLPAVMVAPIGASVVYGQPDEGMVHVAVNGATQAEFRALIDRMDGDRDRFWAVVAGDA